MPVLVQGNGGTRMGTLWTDSPHVPMFVSIYQHQSMHQHQLNMTRCDIHGELMQHQHWAICCLFSMPRYLKYGIKKRCWA